MKCFVSWMPANSHVRSNKPQPYLKGGPDPLEKEINEILNVKIFQPLVFWYNKHDRFEPI